VKSSDYLTGNQEKDAEIVQDLEQGLHRKRMSLSPFLFGLIALIFATGL
jgi:hypothetical protein